MSLIKNLVKDSIKESEEIFDHSCKTDKTVNKVKTYPIIKSATDLQRLKIEKLMKNPEKQVVISEPRKEKDYMASVPTFVRNVMGSSAGAGSGEFHVYRHLRRKEYARQKLIQAKSAKQEADEAYQRKLEENRRIAEEKTAKKRSKRLKKKLRAKKSRVAIKTETTNEKQDSDHGSDHDSEQDKFETNSNNNINKIN